MWINFQYSIGFLYAAICWYDVMWLTNDSRLLLSSGTALDKVGSVPLAKFEQIWILYLIPKFGFMLLGQQWMVMVMVMMMMMIMVIMVRMSFFLNGYRNLAISCGYCEVLLDLRVVFHQSRLSRLPVTWFLLLVNVHVNGEYPHGGCLYHHRLTKHPSLMKSPVECVQDVHAKHCEAVFFFLPSGKLT